MIRNYIPTATVGILMFVIDRVTKSWAYNALFVKDIFVCKGISFTLTFNTGVAWSLGAGNGIAGTSCIVFVTFMLLYTILHHTYQKMCADESIIPEMFVLAGGMSNVLDRFMYPGVIDFIKISFKGSVFPIFNIADISICIGIMLIMYHYVLKHPSCSK